MRKIDIEEVKQYINAQSPETRIYIGVDSERIKINRVWYADYTAAIVVHIDGKHGCKLFGEVTRERDYDQRANRPNTRLMTEVYKVSELYLKLADVLENRLVVLKLLQLSPVFLSLLIPPLFVFALISASCSSLRIRSASLAFSFE